MEEVLIKMYLTGAPVHRVEDITHNGDTIIMLFYNT